MSNSDRSDRNFPGHGLRPHDAAHVLPSLRRDAVDPGWDDDLFLALDGSEGEASCEVHPTLPFGLGARSEPEGPPSLPSIAPLRPVSILVEAPARRTLPPPPGVSSAAPKSPPEDFETLYTRGVEALIDRRLREAFEAFEAASRVGTSASLVANLARLRGLGFGT